MKKFGAGLIVQVAIKIMAAGLGFFSTRWLITTLSVQDYTTYNLILSYNAALLMALWLGVPQIIQKYYTNVDDSKTLKDLWTTFAVFRFASYFLGLLIILATYRISQTNELGLIIGLYTAQFILIADFAYRSVCDAIGNAWKFSITDFIGKFTLVVVLYITSILSAPDSFILPTIDEFLGTNLSQQLLQISPLRNFDINFLVFFIATSIFAYTLSLLIDAFWNRKHTKFGSFDVNLLRSNTRPIVFLGISYVSYALYFTTLPLFIKFFGWGEEMVSGYANAYKFFEIASIIPGLTMPTIASMVKKRMNNNELFLPMQKILPNFATLSDLGIKYLIYFEWFLISLVIGIGTFIGLFIFGPFALRLVDPNLVYPLAIPALQILALASIPQSIMYLTSTLNILYDGEKFELIASIILATTAMILYSVLIRMYGIYGAVWALTIMYSFDFVIKLYFLNRNLRNKTALSAI